MARDSDRRLAFSLFQVPPDRRLGFGETSRRMPSPKRAESENSAAQQFAPAYSVLSSILTPHNFASSNLQSNMLLPRPLRSILVQVSLTPSRHLLNGLQGLEQPRLRRQTSNRAVT
jgi:hypothetical protein